MSLEPLLTKGINIIIMVSYERYMLFDGDAMNNIPVFSEEDHHCLDGRSPFEILLGKEKSIFNHEGNKRFRAIINYNVHKYISATTKSQKSKLVRKIHADMQKAGFRVMKRDKQSGAWCGIKESDAREKLSHALRDRVREMKRPSKRAKKAPTDGIYPMIISMAKALQENQKLLKEVMAPSFMATEIKSSIPSSSKASLPESCPYMNSNDVSSNNNLVDIIGSFQTNNSDKNEGWNLPRTGYGTFPGACCQGSLGHQTTSQNILPLPHQRQVPEDLEPLPLPDNNLDELSLVQMPVNDCSSFNGSEDCSLLDIADDLSDISDDNQLLLEVDDCLSSIYSP